METPMVISLDSPALQLCPCSHQAATTSPSKRHSRRQRHVDIRLLQKTNNQSEKRRRPSRTAKSTQHHHFARPVTVKTTLRLHTHTHSASEQTKRNRMALVTSPTQQKGIVITVPVLVLSLSVAAIFFFFLLSSLSTCNCPLSSTTTAAGNAVRNGAVSDFARSEDDSSSSSSRTFSERTSATKEDIEWVRDQIHKNGLHMQDNVLRKGINPRTRAQQLQDLIQ